MSEKTIHRIDSMREFYNLSPKELEEKLGMSNGSFAKNLKADASVKDDVIRKILEVFPKVSLRYLILGEGEIEGLDQDDPEKLIEHMVLNHDEYMKSSLLYREKMKNLAKDEFIKLNRELLESKARK